MNSYVEKFYKDLDLIRTQYITNKDMDLSDDWKTILDNDELFNMLRKFGTDVINYGYNSVSGFDAEYTPDTNDLVGIFCNYLLQMYKTNMMHTSDILKVLSKHNIQSIYIGRKNELVWSNI